MCGKEIGNEEGMMYQFAGPKEIGFVHTDIRYLCDEDTIYFKRIMELATNTFNEYVDKHQDVQGKMIKDLQFEVKLLRMRV